MKRLCILVGGYYPYYGNPMGMVLSKFCPLLTREYSVSVITLRNVFAPIVERQVVHDGVEIVTLTSWFRESALSEKARFRRFLANAYCKCRFLFGGTSSQDYIAALFFNELESQMKRRGVDIVLSLGFPVQTHVAASRFKKRHPDVRWVTYSTDTFFLNIDATEVRFDWLRGILDRRRTSSEMACYKSADYNFFSREIFNSCRSYLSPVLAKSGILDYALIRGIQRSRQNRHFDSAHINLLFAGGVGRPMRDPSYFAEVFSLLPKSLGCVLHLWLLPHSAAFFEKGVSELGARVVLHSPVSPEEMQDIMREADILVNLGNDSDVFSPSKLFDYVSTGRPLVCTTYANRRINEILTRIPNVLILENYSDARKDAQRLALFCERMKGKVTSFDDVQRLLPEYSVSCIAQKLCSKLTRKEVV